MKIDATVDGTTLNYNATFELEDFPRRELLKSQGIHIPDSYKGSSDDPYMVDAFNAALATNNPFMIYIQSIGVAASKTDGLLVSRFILDRFKLGSMVFNNMDADKVFQRFQKAGVKVTDFQFYYWLTAFIINSQKDNSFRTHGALKHFFGFTENYKSGELPDAEILYYYKQLNEIQCKIIDYRVTDFNQAQVYEDFSSQLWKMAENMTFDKLLRMQTVFSNVKPSAVTNFNAAFEAMELYVNDPENFTIIVESAPKDWLERIMKFNKK